MSLTIEYIKHIVTYSPDRIRGFSAPPEIVLSTKYADLNQVLQLLLQKMTSHSGNFSYAERSVFLRFNDKYLLTSLRYLI
jgi:hypothetical protein